MSFFIRSFVVRIFIAYFIFSLTTSPKRLDKIHHVLETLDLTHVEKSLINLPWQFSNGGEFYDQTTIEKISALPKVQVLRPEKYFFSD